MSYVFHEQTIKVNPYQVLLWSEKNFTLSGKAALNN